MAKKKEETSISEFGSNISRLEKIFNKISPNAEILKDSEYANIDNYISTGNYILNACISGSLFGGIMGNRGLGLAGSFGCIPKNEKVEIYVMKTNTHTFRNIHKE